MQDKTQLSNAEAGKIWSRNQKCIYKAGNKSVRLTNFSDKIRKTHISTKRQGWGRWNSNHALEYELTQSLFRCISRNYKIYENFIRESTSITSLNIRIKDWGSFKTSDFHEISTKNFHEHLLNNYIRTVKACRTLYY